MLLFQNHLYQPNDPIKSKVVMLNLNVEFEWTTTSMSPTWHIPKLRLFCAFSLVLVWDWKFPSKKNKVEVLHLHHVRYPYPWYSCQTPSYLDLYPPMEKHKLKNEDAKFQA
jgi:hypothetical protein